MRTSVPLYQAKAELFRTLGHPARIRVLELLQDGPLAVRDLLAELDIEPSSLSQQLAVLRRAGLVTSMRNESVLDNRAPRTGVLVSSRFQRLTRQLHDGLRRVRSFH